MNLYQFMGLGFVLVLALTAAAWWKLRRVLKDDPDEVRIFTVTAGCVLCALFVAISPLLHAVPFYLYVVLASMTILVPAITHHIRLAKSEYRYHPVDVVMTWVLAACLAILCVVVGNFNYSTTSDSTQAFVWADGKGKVQFRYPNTFGAYECSGCLLLPYSEEPTVGVTPITSNPKARHIELTVHAEVIDFQKYITTVGLPVTDTHEEFVEDRDRLRRAIRRELNEVTNTYSKELAEFYNPDDDDQCRRLQAFILEHANPRLAPKGIRVTKLVTWTVS